jgi:hypothetical protein
MEIDRPFIRLPFAFDADRLAQEVKALSDDTWMDHPLGLRGNFAIPLISREGSDNDDFHGRMCVTPHLEACLYLQQAMASFGEVLGRSRLMKLAAGCEVSEHIDFNYHWYTRVRIHIPIATNAGVTFYCADESVHMRPGECWIFNSWCRHRVVNAGMQERIHLVIDASGSSRFWRIVRRMQQMDPHTDAAAVDALVERVFFDPQKQVRVLTEQFNIAPVMSPGEVDALVADLVRDFSQSASNDCHRVTHYANVLSDFARDWREIWHQYGYGRDGWPAYRATIAAVHGQLHPDPGALVTQNGVGVNRIIVQRILKPALATDQFDRFTSS